MNKKPTRPLHISFEHRQERYSNRSNSQNNKKRFHFSSFYLVGSTRTILLFSTFAFGMTTNSSGVPFFAGTSVNSTSLSLANSDRYSNASGIRRSMGSPPLAEDGLVNEIVTIFLAFLSSFAYVPHRFPILIGGSPDDSSQLSGLAVDAPLPPRFLTVGCFKCDGLGVDKPGV